MNGQAVEFLLNTAATTVSLSKTAAAQLGLSNGQTIRVSAANGVTAARRSEIAELKIGINTLKHVPASRAPYCRGTEILICKWALKQLKIRKQGKQLT
ncbi:retropepsin-like aspartic protease family protein [Alishewanella longhuensis]